MLLCSTQHIRIYNRNGSAVPSILQPTAEVATVQVEFVASPALDILNAMYFTHLAHEMEGLDEWPRRTRAAMAPALRDDLDYLFTYPGHQCGIMGALNDATLVMPGRPNTVADLLRFLRDLPATVDGEREPGHSVQGFALYALRCFASEPPSLPDRASPRDVLRLTLEHASLPVDDPHPPIVPITPAEAVVLFDVPEDLRSRMLALIERFYEEHYRADEGRRLACLRRSAEAHRQDEARRRQPVDPAAIASALAGTHVSCMHNDPADYTRLVFVPSLDVGPYISSVDLPPAFAMYYRCEAEFRGEGAAADDERTHRMALVYQALSDELRLKILRLLAGGELYAQQIVERTGAHQSVVSRHLSFMKAVGLLEVRRQNNMKFYSINGEMRSELRRSLDAILPAAE